MTLTKKIIVVGLLAVLSILTFTGGMSVAFAAANQSASNAPQKAVNDIKGYYGSKLTDPVDIAIYKAMETMDYTTGVDTVEISCDGIEALAMRYAHGDKELLQRFGAASDCIYFDYPELFYVDFDNITLSVGLKNGNYFVRIGTGKTANYFKKGVTRENLPEMLETYNAQMDSLVSQIKAKIDWATKNWKAAPDKKDIASFICQFIDDRITYGFCRTDSGDDTVNSTFIRTTYGALVVRECVCEGYARLYKALCDRFDIDCVLVFGDYVRPDGSVEPHGWNAVYLQDTDKGDTEEYWYAVDPTFEDTGTNGKYANRYFVVTKDYIEADHFANPVISSSGHQMPYPTLKSEQIEMPSGLLSASYIARNGNIYLSVNYNGLNAEQLYTTGNDGQKLWLAFRVLYGDQWGPWTSIFAWNRMYATRWQHYDHSSEFLVDSNIVLGSYQLAVFDVIDDAGLPDTGGYYSYYSDKAVKEHLVEHSTEIENPSFDPYYVAPAYVKTVTYSYEKDGKTVSGNNFQTSMQELGYEYTITVEYTQKLKKLDDEAPVTISYELRQYDEYRTTNLEEARENCSLKDVEVLNDTTVRFKFTPSPLFQHNKIWYTFAVGNLVNIPVGDNQVGVAPNTFSTLWGYTDTVVCTKCLGGGRYLLDNVYAQPALIDDSDLSMNGWTYEDENGKIHKVSESQRSNLALVVTTPSAPVMDNIEMNLDAAVAKSAGNEATIAASQTYEIDLQICGQIASIPNGSYLKIKLGYPKGFTYDSTMEGVTFKLFHFKRNAQGKLDYAHPEEIECVFTELGIIALVESFSPYTIVAINNAEDTTVTARSVTTQFNGLGGELHSSADKPVVSLEENQSVTYTLNPYAGYDIEYALLNGTPVAVTDGTITLTYADLPKGLAASVLSVGYVATAVKTEEKKDGIINMSLAYVANTVATDSIAIDDDATADEVFTTLIAANNNIFKVITGQAETATEAPLAAGTMPTVYEITIQSDGEVKFPSVIACAGEELLEPTLERPGYLFDGWTMNGEACSFPETMPAENITIKANWAATEITLTFDTKGGNSIDAITANAGSPLTVADPTKEYYEFVGWKIGGKYVSLNVMPDVSSVAEAVWGHSVTFDTDGGSEIAKMLVAEGDVTTAPHAPTKEGCTFDGWLLLEQDEKFVFGTIIERNITLKAVWTMGKYTITFDANGGNTIDSITDVFDADIAVPENPTKKGHAFAGWTLNGESYTLDKMPSHDLHLVAKWTANEYTVTFNSNGGTDVKSIKVKYDRDIPVPQEPTKEGYHFAGWMHNGKPYTFGKMPAEDLTLEAHWRAVSTGNEPTPANTTMYIILGLEVAVVVLAIVILVLVKKRRRG